MKRFLAPAEPFTDPWLVTADEDREETHALTGPDSLDPLMERVGKARLVLLGEASHGTHEYYTWRTRISQRLIAEKGFNFIAVEGDWPACFRLNLYLKGGLDQSLSVPDVLGASQRWPEWMWANWEVAALAEWMKTYNSGKTAGRKAGFYGLDVYSLWESMETLVSYLERKDPTAAALARQALRCFEPYGRDWRRYLDALRSVSLSCRDEVLQLLGEIRQKAPSLNSEPEASLNAEQNALVAAGAETYYRSMLGFNDESWNIRDTHMADTLQRLLDFHGRESKAIVWEHNTHVGDARYTDMRKAGLVNVGQLARERLGRSEVVIVGFGSYKGEVIAAREWGAPMERMRVPPAKRGSVERILHEEGEGDRLLLFNPANKRERFGKVLPHRAIGVVYDPETEHYGNYVPTVLNERYDAFIFLDTSSALHPLPPAPSPQEGMPPEEDLPPDEDLPTKEDVPPGENM